MCSFYGRLLFVGLYPYPPPVSSLVYRRIVSGYSMTVPIWCFGMNMSHLTHLLYAGIE